jgi:lipopolysaccharide transport system permease protein
MDRVGEHGTREPRWDVVVQPHQPWWHVDLVEIWRYRDLIRLLMRRDLLAVYKQTLLGPLWQIVQPLLTSVMFGIVFGLLGRGAIPAEYPPFLFFMSGVVPWTFFANVLTRTSQTLVSNASLMTKVYFPRLVSPIATTLGTSVSAFIQLASFFVIAIGYRLTGAYEWAPDTSIFGMLILIPLLMLLAFGLGIIVSALTTKFRDLTFLVGFGVQLLMYASPVIIPISSTEPGSLHRLILQLNPMSPVIDGFRAALLGSPMDWSSLSYTLVFSIITLFIGVVLFQRMERSFADVV